MSEEKRYLLRRVTGDQAAQSEQEIRTWFQTGQCKPADFLFDFSAGKWMRAGDLPGINDLFGNKPAALPEKKLIYYVTPGATPMPQGPFSTRDIQGRMQSREICESTWVFVDGDKEWRQVKTVKVLYDMLPALPVEVPAAPAPAPEVASAVAAESVLMPPEQTSPSIRIDLSAEEAPPPAPPSDGYPEPEEATMAFSTLGLSLKVDHSEAAQTEAPPPPPPPVRKPPVPPPAAAAAPVTIPPAPGISLGSSVPPSAPSAPPPPPAAKEAEQGSFDGITAEISTDPIWLVKQSNSEAVSGPFRFLDVMKFLEEGRLNKNDKISKSGTNRFVKIQQQYEFNVKYSVETVIEHGVERQKIFIKRRHPRVPYFTGVQIITQQGLVAGNCVNISAGGILVEILKAEFNLGDILEVKILPGVISRSISCKALVIGKLPKMPPAYALKFEDLKNDDKETIEIYVQETLKRENQT